MRYYHGNCEFISPSLFVIIISSQLDWSKKAGNQNCVDHFAASNLIFIKQYKEAAINLNARPVARRWCPAPSFTNERGRFFIHSDQRASCRSNFEINSVLISRQEPISILFADSWHQLTNHQSIIIVLCEYNKLTSMSQLQPAQIVSWDSWNISRRAFAMASCST